MNILDNQELTVFCFDTYNLILIKYLLSLYGTLSSVIKLDSEHLRYCHNQRLAHRSVCLGKSLTRRVLITLLPCLVLGLGSSGRLFLDRFRLDVRCTRLLLLAAKTPRCERAITPQRHVHHGYSRLVDDQAAPPLDRVRDVSQSRLPVAPPRHLPLVEALGHVPLANHSVVHVSKICETLLVF